MCQKIIEDTTCFQCQLHFNNNLHFAKSQSYTTKLIFSACSTYVTSLINKTNIIKASDKIVYYIKGFVTEKFAL